VSCPCALSLATPAAITAATSQLSDMGLMLRSKTALSKLAGINQIFFDKTGTLTTGVMQLNQIKTYNDYSKEQCLQIAHLLENISNHPIAAAFDFDVSKLTMTSEQLSEEIGLGVTGIIDGFQYRLGSKKFIQSWSINLNKQESDNFGTQLYLANKEGHIATFSLQDSVKPTASAAVEKLNSLNYKLALLSGDSKQSVQKVAKELSVSTIVSDCSPRDKLNYINQSQKSGLSCLMVGDGFNDVGALAAASMSITMGTGTKVSKTASDAVLVSSNLSVIPDSLLLAKKVQRIIKQNLSWAIAYNILAVPFAMMGLIPAWLAAIGMSLSSLIVVLNALRLRN